MASFAHNALKMVRKLGRGMVPADAVSSGADQAMDDGLVDAVTSPVCLIWLSWRVRGEDPGQTTTSGLFRDVDYQTTSPVSR